MTGYKGMKKRRTVWDAYQREAERRGVTLGAYLAAALNQAGGALADGAALLRPPISVITLKRWLYAHPGTLRRVQVGRRVTWEAVTPQSDTL